MSKYAKRLAALTPHQMFADVPTREEIDAAVAALTAHIGEPPARGTCLDCEFHAEAVVTWLQADLDGYPVQEPIHPPCWQTHQEQTCQ